MNEVLVEGLGEDRVDLFSKMDLSHLQLGQVVGHHCILEVGVHHFFKKTHVFAIKLTHALVNQSAYLGVTCLFVINDILDIVFTVSQIFDEFAHIFEHHFSVGKNLLTLHKIANCCLGDISFVVQDGNSIKMLLAVEQHVETCLLEVFNIEFVWHLTEYGAVSEVEGVNVEDL